MQSLQNTSSGGVAAAHEVIASAPFMGHHVSMTRAGQTQWIIERARAAGFDLCGIAPVESAVEKNGYEPPSDAPPASHVPFDELRHLPEWLARGYAGEMAYLHDPRRADPRMVLGGARSLIVVALNYNSPHPRSTTYFAADSSDQSNHDSPRGWISRYAWGDDYHDVIQQKLRALIADMRAQFPEPFEARTYTDTGPIIERVAAKYAGLGWLAKNTCLINSRLGSWLFLGVIITTLDLKPTLAPGEAPPADLCGKCTRCLDACPTQAFVQPYVLDATRCISYLTIELRGKIPEDLRPDIGAAVIGCDICQDVCPWNHKAPVNSVAAFQPREIIQSEPQSNASNGHSITETEPPLSLLAPELEWLASLSQKEFSAVFRGSAVKRAKWRGLVRNACVALGNSRIEKDHPAWLRIVTLLNHLAAGEDPLITEHAQWALQRLSDAACFEPLNLPFSAPHHDETELKT